jgi:hypothetical protein
MSFVYLTHPYCHVTVRKLKARSHKLPCSMASSAFWGTRMLAVQCVNFSLRCNQRFHKPG